MNICEILYCIGVDYDDPLFLITVVTHVLNCRGSIRQHFSKDPALLESLQLALHSYRLFPSSGLSTLWIRLIGAHPCWPQSGVLGYLSQVKSLQASQVSPDPVQTL